MPIPSIAPPLSPKPGPTKGMSTRVMMATITTTHPQPLGSVGGGRSRRRASVSMISCRSRLSGEFTWALRVLH